MKEELERLERKITDFIMTNVECQSLLQLLTENENGYRLSVDIKPYEVKVHLNGIIGQRGTGIRLTFDDKTSKEFTSQEALFYVVRTVGYARCHELIPNIVFDVEPTQRHIVETDDSGNVWFINIESGINQRVAKLNQLFKKIGNNWSAERIDDEQK